MTKDKTERQKALEALETARLTINTGGIITRDTEVYKMIVEALTLIQAAQHKPVEVGETTIASLLANMFGNLPLTEAMPQTWRSILKYLAAEYPHGLRIVPTEGEKK